MVEIHCHSCGGFISDRSLIAYLLPLERGRTAVPRTSLCECAQPILYAPPPGHASIPGMLAVPRMSR